MELNFLPGCVRSYLTVTGRAEGAISDTKLKYAGLAIAGIALVGFGLLACIYGSFFGFKISLAAKVCMLLGGTISCISSLYMLHTNRASALQQYVSPVQTPSSTIQ